MSHNATSTQYSGPSPASDGFDPDCSTCEAISLLIFGTILPTALYHMVLFEGSYVAHFEKAQRGYFVIGCSRGLEKRWGASHFD